ncbi:MAG: hypothetical protein QOG52_271 [Frankiaceae bacterium]|jgi:hypothetical protein|nr:hypothetical protein [Frankiaceae bacterium]
MVQLGSGGLFGRPAFLRGFHGWMTLGWGLLVPITVLTNLKTSITWIALMSVWANFVGHFSSWQAARVEVKQDEQIDDTTEQVDKTEDKLNAINTAR